MPGKIIKRTAALKLELIGSADTISVMRSPAQQRISGGASVALSGAAAAAPYRSPGRAAHEAVPARWAGAAKMDRCRPNGRNGDVRTVFSRS
jgi:hypothetical protein